MRPGLRRPAAFTSRRAAALIGLASAAGAVAFWSAAAGAGPFAALHPQSSHRLAASVAREPIDAQELFPPPSPGVVYREIEVDDPPPPAPLAAAPPREIEPSSAEASPEPAEPSPSPTSDDQEGTGTGGIDP